MKHTASIVIILLFFLSCTDQKELMYRKSSEIMDTVVAITVVSGSKEKAEEAIDAAFNEIRKLEALLSFWTEDSEIAAINKNAGESEVRVSPETIDIIDKALYISRQTEGAFDATIGPVIRQWDFRAEKLPEEGSLKKALGLVNYREMETDSEQSTAFLKKGGMSFDTGGIAKGFAADRAVGILKSLGIKAGLVSVAGDIRAFGLRPDGKGWQVGIRDPRSDDKDKIMASIELIDEAVSTSGDYERFFVRDGVLYHHLLDPKTGYPAIGCISVTVIAKDAVLTDGLSTGVFVMGPKKGLHLLERLGLDGVIITSDGRRLVTEGIKGRVRWTQNG